MSDLWYVNFHQLIRQNGNEQKGDRERIEEKKIQRYQNRQHRGKLHSCYGPFIILNQSKRIIEIEWVLNVR